jgi:hypothetical protein
MPRKPAFDFRALYDALDRQRRARQLTWAGVAREVSARRTWRRPISPSTIARLKHQEVGEGDGILQLLLWLGRAPESFCPDASPSDPERHRLPDLTRGQILRWDTRSLFAAADARRLQRRLTWVELARQVGEFTPGMLRNLAKGGRIDFPRVMRLVRWLERPAVEFMYIADW